MKKEIKVIDKKKGIVQITTLSERWYSRQVIDTKTGLPIFEYLPSSSYIAGYYPKGIVCNNRCIRFCYIPMVETAY